MELSAFIRHWNAGHIRITQFHNVDPIIIIISILQWKNWNTTNLTKVNANEWEDLNLSSLAPGSVNTQPNLTNKLLGNHYYN